jgi:hypothetical protein
MKHKSIIVSLVVGLSYVGYVSGQGVVSEDLSRGAGQVGKSQTAVEMAQAAVAAKGWNEGHNVGSSGNEFYIAIGVSNIRAPLDNPNYITSRMNAFQSAQLNAWAEIRRFVGATIAARAGSIYKEASASGEMPSANEPSPTQAKVKALLDGVLDRALERVGVDPATATPVQREQALTTDFFQRSAAVAAAGPIVGVQSWATFEGSGRGEGYQIAVVAIWSPKLQEMAQSMFTLEPFPPGVPGKAVSEWIPTEPLERLTTFGVQMIRDENGHPVLISYGQDAPLTASSRSVDAAVSKARNTAMMNLRFFAGAQLKAFEDFSSAESVEEFADGTAAYASESTFQEQIDVLAPAASFSGISTVHTWVHDHPITGKPVAGTVVAWRPQSALLANRMGEQMAAPPRRSQATTPAAQPAQPARQRIDDRGLSGAGSRASDDF